MRVDIYAVLTGDLVGSRNQPAEQIDAAIEILACASDEFGKYLNQNLSFTRYRGDGWQVILSQPKFVLRAMIYLRARLIASGIDIDTRISAGIGPIETIGTVDLSDASGKAFFISGDQLETAKKRRMVIGGECIGIWQNAVLMLADQIVSNWSAAQAEAAAIDVLESTTQEEIAIRLGITRQAVQLRLASSGVASLSEAFEAFRTLDYGRMTAHD